MIGYSISNIAQIRVCRGDFGLGALLNAGAGMLLTRGGGKVFRAFGFVRFGFTGATGLASTPGAADFRFFAGAFLAADVDFGGADLAFVTRSLFAFGAADFRFRDGAFLVLF
jgi:hypothetical protein